MCANPLKTHKKLHLLQDYNMTNLDTSISISICNDGIFSVRSKIFFKSSSVFFLTDSGTIIGSFNKTKMTGLIYRNMKGKKLNMEKVTFKH